MATRKKTTVVVNITEADAINAMHNYAVASNELDKINAEINEQIIKIKEKYKDRISVLEATQSEAFEEIKSYATENKSSLFEKKKSVEFDDGIFGFRTGTPKLKLIKGFKWDTVLEKIKMILPKDYIRYVEEIAKDKILADRDKLVEKLPECGVEVVQDESFYVKTK